MSPKNTPGTIEIFDGTLKTAKIKVYDACDYEFANLKINSESLEYEACTFEIKNKKIIHRTAKITPKKVGHFVTVWKRNQHGITEPYDVSDEFDFLIVTTKFQNKLGQFIFPKSILAQNGIITENGKSGKRGMRIYTPWDIVTNKQAAKTQNWQVKYFISIYDENPIELQFFKQLIKE